MHSRACATYPRGSSAWMRGESAPPGSHLPLQTIVTICHLVPQSAVDMLLDITIAGFTRRRGASHLRPLTAANHSGYVGHTIRRLERGGRSYIITTKVPPFPTFQPHSRPVRTKPADLAVGRSRWDLRDVGGWHRWGQPRIDDVLRPQLSHGAPTYAAVLALMIVGTESAYASIDRCVVQPLPSYPPRSSTLDHARHRPGPQGSVFCCQALLVPVVHEPEAQRRRLQHAP
jgi:hypothetical protein